MIAVDYAENFTTILFNAEPFHTAPIALLYADQALLRHLVNASYSLAAANHPLPQTAEAKVEEESEANFNGDSFAYANNIMFGYSFLAASFVVFLIRERAMLVLKCVTPFPGRQPQAKTGPEI